MSTAKPQLLPLTGMRFFLALWVVLFHQAQPEGYLGPLLSVVPGVVFSALRTGYVAVGVFFVLSGFVLSYNYSLAAPWLRRDVLRFAIARLARIYPAYVVGLVLMAPLVVYPLARDFSAGVALREAAVAALNGMLLQAWIPQTATTWNSPGWSLSAEAFFYCCFPFVGVALWRLSRARSVLTAGVLVWLLALVAPAVAVMLPAKGLGDEPATSLLLSADPRWASFLTLNPLLRLPDFCIGILLGRVFHTLRLVGSPLMGRGYWLYLPGLTAELFVVARADTLPLPLFSNGLLLPLHALVILGFALGGGTACRLLSLRGVVFLGNASYALYILHFPVAKWMDLAAARALSSSVDGLGMMLAYVAAAVALSCVVFSVLEEPLNRVLKVRLTARFVGVAQPRAIEHQPQVAYEPASAASV